MPDVTPAIGSAVGIDPGYSVHVVQAAAAVNNAPIGTAATAGNTVEFSVQPRADAGNRQANFSAIGNGGAVPTTVTVDLLAKKTDAAGNIVWTKYAAGLTLVAAGVNTDQQVNLVGGQVYRLNISALTLGGASSVDLVVSGS
jgi:hypothetical protein